MRHPMFSYDEVFTNSIFEYCRDRLEHDAPLDFGMHSPVPLPDLDGMISIQGRDPQEVLEFFRDQLAQHVVSIDSPRFLAFIPNAPTKNSLLFDMVVACSGLNGTSWLESAGVVIAENQALEFLAARAGMPQGSGGAFVSGGSSGNLSALTVGRDVGRERRPHIAAHQLRFAISADAHSSIGKALHVPGDRTSARRTRRPPLHASQSGEGPRRRPPSRERDRNRRHVGNHECGYRRRLRGSG